MPNKRPAILTIFGATGDLTTRKLLPALYNLDRQGLLPDDFQIIAFSRRDYDNQQYFDFIADFIKQKYPSLIDQVSWQKFSKKLTYFQGNFDSADDFNSLRDFLRAADQKVGQCLDKYFYLAITPEQYQQVLDGIKNSQLHMVCDEQQTKVIIEKPFGSDLNSFQQLNGLIHKMFDEEQIYRIDHYLAKETVENLLYFRGANPVLSNDWSNSNIDSIEVKVFESIGIENRVEYYDKYGQLRDMLQSHLLQLLALTTMQIPASLNVDLVSQAKAEILSKLKIRDLKQDVVRGQYQAGVVDGQAVIGYQQEAGISADSQTETFVKISAYIDDEKWRNIKINLTTGKRLKEKLTEIVINFKSEEKIQGLSSNNSLRFRIQPDEEIALRFLVKTPGKHSLQTADMKFSYKESFNLILPEAYEKVLEDIITGRKVNFLTTKELEASWQFIDPIIEYWQTSNDLKYYPAGSTNLLS